MPEDVNGKMLEEVLDYIKQEWEKDATETVYWSHIEDNVRKVLKVYAAGELHAPNALFFIDEIIASATGRGNELPPHQEAKPISVSQKAILAARTAWRAWGDGLDDFGVGGNSMIDLILDNVEGVTNIDEAVQIMKHHLFRDHVPFVLMDQLKERYEFL